MDLSGKCGSQGRMQIGQDVLLAFRGHWNNNATVNHLAEGGQENKQNHDTEAEGKVFLSAINSV